MKQLFYNLWSISVGFVVLAFSTGACSGQKQGNDGTTPYQVISKGGDAGDYQAFPDACRLSNGDIVAVFYAGDGHVTYPSEQYPNAGRICMVRSTDEGNTWSTPVTIYDDVDDNRDPHISQLEDGTLIVAFFSLTFGDEIERNMSGQTPIHYSAKHRERFGTGVYIVKSFDQGATWEKDAQRLPTEGSNYYCSAPIRQLKSGSLLFPVYHQDNDAKTAWGGVICSNDKGQSWGSEITIGKEAGLFLPAETDVVELQDGAVYAALRGSIKDSINMHYSISTDSGVSWSDVQDIGFQGHAPHFTRMSSGAIVLTYRAFRDNYEYSTGYTGMRVSYDEGETWQGPYLLDEFYGAYSATVELSEDVVLAVYYEEGANSGVRIAKVRIPGQSNQSIPLDSPIQLEKLALD